MSRQSNDMNDTKWIELIRVRSSADVLLEAMPALTEQIKGIEGVASDAETFFMQHALYDGDLAVVIVWRNHAEPRKSREGLMVAERMQALGSIDHAVWIPVDTD